MAMHRAMIPLLTMNMTRSCVIPDNQKVRKACHVALQEAYQEVLHVVLPLNLTMSKAEEDLHNSSLMQSPVGKAFPSTQDDEEEEESKGDAAEKSAIDADVSGKYIFCAICTYASINLSSSSRCSQCEG